MEPIVATTFSASTSQQTHGVSLIRTGVHLHLVHEIVTLLLYMDAAFISLAATTDTTESMTSTDMTSLRVLGNSWSR